MLPVSSLNYRDSLVELVIFLKQVKNVSIYHHGNLCSVEHDDVAPLADTAEKQMHATVPCYLVACSEWTRHTKLSRRGSKSVTIGYLLSGVPRVTKRQLDTHFLT